MIIWYIIYSIKLNNFFQVFDYDRYSRNDIIGELRIDLAEIELTSNVEIWGDISRTKKVCPLVAL